VKSCNFWLITGGAGYIGSHIVEEFVSARKKVIVLDSLRNGSLNRIKYLESQFSQEIPFFKCDIRDIESLSSIFKEFKFDGVIHTAGLKSVSESVSNPEEYFEVNFRATESIIGLLRIYEVPKFIFSSTAAVYDSPKDFEPVREIDLKLPISPYGASKLAAENAVNEFLEDTKTNGTSLRFFNVIGTSSREMRDNSVDNLVPKVMERIVSNQPPMIYGTEYPTADGTCIRDFVDVRDIARAHLETANEVNKLPSAFNVGTGQGHSVLAIIQSLLKMSGTPHLEPIDAGPRPGDSPYLCANVELLRNRLNFETKYSLERSLFDASKYLF
jgi:UDP-glucose 4-epimerase